MPKYLCHLLLLSLLFANTAHAHRTKVFAWVEGDTIRGEVYFGGGAIAEGAGVDLLLGEHLLASTKADSRGEFSFQRLEAKDYLVRANAGQGHLASFEVSVSEFPESPKSPSDGREHGVALASSPVPDQVPASCVGVSKADIIRALQPLRTQLDQYEAKIRWHDILGGLGYICGLFGLWSLMRSRRS